MQILSVIMWIIENWKKVLIILVLVTVAYSYYWVDNRRYNERNAYWEEKIRTVPVKIDTVYNEILVGAKPIIRGPQIDEAMWRAKLDSIHQEAGRSLKKHRELLEHYTEHYSTRRDDTLMVVAEDTNLSFGIPYNLTVHSHPLWKQNSYVLTPSPFKFKSREITRDRLLVLDVENSSIKSTWYWQDWAVHGDFVWGGQLEAGLSITPLTWRSGDNSPENVILRLPEIGISSDLKGSHHLFIGIRLNIAHWIPLFSDLYLSPKYGFKVGENRGGILLGLGTTL